MLLKPGNQIDEFIVDITTGYPLPFNYFSYLYMLNKLTVLSWIWKISVNVAVLD